MFLNMWLLEYMKKLRDLRSYESWIIIHNIMIFLFSSGLFNLKQPIEAELL